ncbi:MAG: alpha-amylase family glycosyl hydrolase [Culicoidibacterales bacterium]
MKTKNWWKAGVCYQIYVPGFNDSNGDGIGDLDGIIEKLPYLNSLGITIIWLTPFYPSPKVDNGYDVSNYCNIDSSYGTLEQFDELIRVADALKIKVVIDLVLNHTSAEHPWFKQALGDKNSNYRQYYHFKKEPLNNWESSFGGSSWTKVAAENCYYYHAFSPQQPDLNWCNPEVLREFYAIFNFWLARGVSGFRFDVINFLSVDEANFSKDNPFLEGIQQHLYDQNQPSIYQTLTKIIAYLKQISPNILLIGEVGSDQLSQLQKYSEKTSLDLIFNFNLGSRKQLAYEEYITELVKTYQVFGSKEITLFFSSHDMSRAITRLAHNNSRKAIILLALQLLLKGIPFIYGGEEYGQRDSIITTIADIKDVFGITAYKSALAANKTKAEALEIAKSKTRDYSRSLLTWSENEEISAFFLALMKIRAAYKALHAGKISQVKHRNGIISFKRGSKKTEMAIIINTTAAEIEQLIAGKIIFSYRANSRIIQPNGIIIIKAG